MASLSFDLGSADELIELFSYPNRPDSCETLVETILHWVMQMIARDGYGAVANANMHIDGEEYFLDLDGPTEMVLGYMEKLPLFLTHGLNALEVIKAIRKDDEFKKREWPTWVDPPLKNRLWDPMDRDRWRFFLPFGMAMLRQKMVNFFHYPPMRLLDEMRDYLADPVPVRLIELMKANGIKTDQEAWLYSTVMDGAPIAAPDDEGTIYNEDKSGKAGTEEREVHLLPIDRFYDYQKCQTELLLRSLCPVGEGFTIPIVIYGSSALKSFNLIWPDAKLSRGANPATFVIILEGKQTPVLCSGHPYAFFAQSQTEVGVGWMKPEAWLGAVKTMINDLSVVRWQIQMSQDAKRDPKIVWRDCNEFWNNLDQRQTVYQLVLHQSSLYYPNPTQTLKFEFRLSLKDVEKRSEDAAKAEQDAAKRLLDGKKTPLLSPTNVLAADIEHAEFKIAEKALPQVTGSVPKRKLKSKNR